MRMILLVLWLAAAALAAPQYQPIFADYHRQVGVPQATRIKAVEDAIDFDGLRIAGGFETTLGQFPYMAGLAVALSTGQTSVCGAALVSNTRLVTAAHCWRHGSSQALRFTVVLASTRLFSGGTRLDTDDVELHAQYNERVLNNDIAIIRITRVAFNRNVNRILLAGGSNQFVGASAVAVGFGVTGDDVGISSNQALSHVTLTVIPNVECRAIYGPSVVLSSTLCTGGDGGRSTCRGDSGGPLAAGNRLIGITSFGSELGCTIGFPAGFIRVSSFAPWIQARM